jgi:hypothetical protein
LAFIRSSSERKELRHIQPFLAEPGLLYHKHDKGVQLIIMEIVNEEITIKCPVFGVSRRHHKNDYVFISKTMRKIAETQEVYPHYELYLYTHNRPAKGKEIERHDITLQWDVALRAKWPPIVTDRVNEYKKLCFNRKR